METHENIKLLRERMGLSQEVLAEKVGYKDRSSIAKIESGAVDLSQSKIAAFANALNVTPAQLMGISGECMAEFKDRLEQALNIRDMKPSDLSKQTGIGEGAISQYRKGAYKASQRNLEKISKALNFSIPWLMGLTDEQSHSIQPTIPPGFSPMPKTSRVPRIGRIACGQPITAEENIEDYDEVLSSWHADFTLSCVGDSMLPKIEDGDVVAIRSQSKVENGEIAAVRIDGEATLKQVFYRDGYLELRPLNSEYESFIFIGKKMENVSIEGKAVGLCRNL